MTIQSGHFRLTPEQRRFKELLAGYPRFSVFWDFDKRECDIEALRAAVGTMSHGERIMASFFAGVWLGENALGFDLIEAARSLEDTHRQVIESWLADPEFP